MTLEISNTLASHIFQAIKLRIFSQQPHGSVDPISLYRQQTLRLFSTCFLNRRMSHNRTSAGVAFDQLNKGAVFDRQIFMAPVISPFIKPDPLPHISVALISL